MEKNCSKCGVTFGCKNEAPGCWCESLQLGTDTLAELRAQYDNCLCPLCLATYAEKDSHTRGASAGDWMPG